MSLKVHELMLGQNVELREEPGFDNSEGSDERLLKGSFELVCSMWSGDLVTLVDPDGVYIGQVNDTNPDYGLIWVQLV